MTRSDFQVLILHRICHSKFFLTIIGAVLSSLIKKNTVTTNYLSMQKLTWDNCNVRTANE